ncbi:hypothetical protein SKP52_14690 [Sphingopyxis fribergensis]|uniref:DUF4352 domain-containing protein n=1 Tax=Sphingopyxis fribergensis TaxID=1515612 RepID=A0A0A7PIJ5_9SPHN|nr:DUF4352 domain-containing protein [Sphingopyxis fribergensis]AJA09820.1 hypothetical protein SKP52_14690 [Sphingopyxis fribergensis]
MITILKPALLALTLTASLTACGESEKPTAEGPKAAAAVDTTMIALGRTGGADGVELTITDVATPIQVGSAESGSKAEQGETFVVVTYTLKNVGSAPLVYMERPELTLLDAEGNSYAEDDIASMKASHLMDDSSGMTSDLNPNVSATTRTAWKVDKSAFDKTTWKVRLDTPSQPLFALK